MNSTLPQESPQGMKRSIRWRAVLDIAAGFAMIGTCVVILASAPWKTESARPGARSAKPDLPMPPDPLSLEGAALRGDSNATVAIIEYSDFQCPFCAKFAAETLPTIIRDYVDTGKALFAFRNLPLTTIHPNAMKAAEAAECARRQRRFWEMHDALFANPKDLGLATLRERASAIGLDVTQFVTCMSGDVAASIRAQAQTAGALQVTGTPSFFIGTVISDMRVKVVAGLSGAQPVATFTKIVDGVLKSAAKQ